MHTIDPNAQIKLVAVDMDGTFLDGDGQIPDEAWGVIDQLQARGIKFVPASGRQPWSSSRNTSCRSRRC